MGIVQNIRDARTARALEKRLEQSKTVAQEIRQRLMLSPICSDYENLFAQVRPLINDMKVIRPFGVDRTGRELSLNKTPELAILNSPNESMGWAEFADLMFATWLTKDQLYIHVHRNEKDEVIGYTVIPASAATWNGYETVWTVTDPDGEQYELHADEVMTLRFSRSPDDPYKGVSPASASRYWAQTDDLIAQYQRAYFENGAIPSTITFITSSTREGYEEMRRELEMKTKGARNHNKTVYAWRQMLPETGQTADQIEVKTIQGGNNTLAIDSIVEIINDRLNKAVGVSNFILGDDSSAKYSNAELSDQQFVKRRVYPALLSFWSQFQHELDRITGGLGYGIQFELEIPELTDRAKTRAETAEKTTKNVIELIKAGADPTSTVEALELSPAWRRVAAGIWNKVLAEEQNTPPLQETNTTNDSHQKACASCQHTHDAKGDLTPTEKKIEAALIDLAQAIIDENPNITEDEVIDRINEILDAEAQKGGQESLMKIRELVDNEEVRKQLTEAIKQGYELSSALEDRIRQRTNQIVRNYGEEVREQMRSILNNTRGLTANEIRAKLKDLVGGYRAKMIARSETTYAFKSGRLDSDMNIATTYDIKLEVEWKCQPDTITCDVCAAMDGQTTTLGEAYAHFVEYHAGDTLKNGRIVGFAPEDATPEERKLYTESLGFDFVPNEWNDQGRIPNAHPNCRCYFDEHVVREAE